MLKQVVEFLAKFFLIMVTKFFIVLSRVVDTAKKTLAN